MSMLALGSYVTHDRLPELGAGEIVLTDDSVTRIRFAAGERAFRTAIVGPHLTVTMEAPAPATPAKSSRRARKS